MGITNIVFTMKDRILEEIDRYERRVGSLLKLKDQSEESITTLRYDTKISIYRDVILDLKRIIKDEENES